MNYAMGKLRIIDRKEMLIPYRVKAVFLSASLYGFQD